MQWNRLMKFAHARLARTTVGAACLVAFFTTRVTAAEQPAESAPALTNWLAASSSFKKVGAFIGQEQYSQAKSQLSSASTNLPAPYNKLATEVLSEFDAALKLSTNHADPQRLQTLVTLCAEISAYEAAISLPARCGAKPSAEELADDPLYAWRLFGSGDTQAALAEYKRRLDKEPVEFWQDYYREQIRLLQQRPAARTNAQMAIETVKEHYLKSLEAHPDLFGALSELTRVVPHLNSAKEAIPIYQLILKCLSRLGDESGRKAWQDKFLADYNSEPEVCAMVYLDRAQRAYHQKDMNAAEALFRRVCNDYAATSLYADALYGVGLVLQDEQKYDAALTEYTKIFSSNANENLLDPESSEDYPNYRFKAALRISECYEATKDLKKALEYALMARDRYKFVSYCKDCLRNTRQNVENRVKQLEQAVNKPATSAIVP